MKGPSNDGCKISGGCREGRWRRGLAQYRLALVSFAALGWLLFRSGRKPSRLKYPCQQAALAHSTLALALLGSGVAGMLRCFTRDRMRAAAILALAAAMFSALILFPDSGLDLASAARPELPDMAEAVLRAATLNPPVFKGAGTAPSNDHDVYWVSKIPPFSGGPRHTGVDALIGLMGESGLYFYDSGRDCPGAGPGGLISSDDVVLLKVNLAYDQRGMTNVDVVQGLITAILSHPEGFTGEVVVVENCEGGGDFDLYNVNGEDIHRTYHSMLDSFGDPSRVSCSSWWSVTDNLVSEFSAGDYREGYVFVGGNISYPKFVTGRGTCVSLKHGIWDGARYDRSRLKLINIPVLKSHHALGATAAVKNFMGVPSIHMTEDVHNDLMLRGFCGRVMNETVFPCLNIIDAVWTSPSHPTGPAAPYSRAVRTDMLLASRDPVMLDYYACKHVLHAVSGYGRHDPDTPYGETSDPYHDGTTCTGYPYNALRLMLESNMQALRAGGHDVTMDISRCSVHGRDLSIALDGGHCAMGSPSPLDQWYFAEGTTREGFDAWACLQNPGTEVGSAQLIFQTAEGEERAFPVELPARSRITVHLNHLLEPGIDFSFAVLSSVPVVAERPMYFRYRDAWTGGHDVLGAASPLQEWFFAEGCTRSGFDTWLCIQNPGAEDALLEIDYHRGDGTTLTRSGIMVAARSRLTIPVHEEGAGNGRHDTLAGDVSIHLRSSNGVPVVAERPMYFQR